MFKTIKKFVLGKPLASKEHAHQKLSKKVALAVFSSDALSSVAYATEAILKVLILAGLAATKISLPIALVIGILLLLLISSYRQTIYTYPSGGGSYIVSKENLGKYPSLIAAGSLLVDYVLTVAVSASEGVRAIVSAVPHFDLFGITFNLQAHAVAIAVVFVIFVTVLNLRGVKESGTIFAIPTYLFIGTFLILIVAGFYKRFSGLPPTPLDASLFPASEGFTTFLVLHAFASGCTALTGVEAISNGIPAFKSPESKNASITLVWMGLILLVFFLGVTELSQYFHIVPKKDETMISQLARQIFEGGFFYYIVQVVTALILFLAANTAFADFPRLSSLIARDGYLPRQLGSMGDRLAFSNGIIVLGFFSGLLIIIFHGETHALLPLYAVGVFLSFTLSQSGMVVHWFKEKSKRWREKAVLNGIGAVATAAATLILAYTKFHDGAWIVVICIPILIMMFLAIHRHYASIVNQLSPDPLDRTLPAHHTVLIPISAFHKGTAKALSYARAIAKDVRAVYVALDPKRTAQFQEIWSQWGTLEIPLVMLESPYRSILEPLRDYIDQLQAEDPDRLITVVLPEFVPAKWWHTLLHNQTAFLIYGALHFKKGVVVTSVRHFLEY